jgi:hypothetical protein
MQCPCIWPKSAAASRRERMLRSSSMVHVGEPGQRIATMLGEDEDWLYEISIELDPEDGRLTVLGLGEEGTTAFTRFGIDNLAELVQIYKANPNLLPRPPE